MVRGGHELERAVCYQMSFLGRGEDAGITAFDVYRELLSPTNCRGGHVKFAGSRLNPIAESHPKVRCQSNYQRHSLDSLNRHRAHATCPNSAHCMRRKDLRRNSSEAHPYQRLRATSEVFIHKTVVLTTFGVHQRPDSRVPHRQPWGASPHLWLDLESSRLYQHRFHPLQPHAA
jgi:hypothetical protein